MARTKQAARKSTGGKAPRFKRNFRPTALQKPTPNVFSLICLFKANATSASTLGAFGELCPHRNTLGLTLPLLTNLKLSATAAKRVVFDESASVFAPTLRLGELASVGTTLLVAFEDRPHLVFTGLPGGKSAGEFAPQGLPVYEAPPYVTPSSDPSLRTLQDFFGGSRVDWGE